jgi:hypothetical protein
MMFFINLILAISSFRRSKEFHKAEHAKGCSSEPK